MFVLQRLFSFSYENIVSADKNECGKIVSMVMKSESTPNFKYLWDCAKNRNKNLILLKLD